MPGVWPGHTPYLLTRAAPPACGIIALTWNYVCAVHPRHRIKNGTISSARACTRDARHKTDRHKTDDATEAHTRYTAPLSHTTSVTDDADNGADWANTC